MKSLLLFLIACFPIIAFGNPAPLEKNHDLHLEKIATHSSFTKDVTNINDIALLSFSIEDENEIEEETSHNEEINGSAKTKLPNQYIYFPCTIYLPIASKKPLQDYCKMVHTTLQDGSTITSNCISTVVLRV